MPSKKRSTSSSSKNISIGRDVVDSVVISGDNNVVNKQTIFQKIINFILPTESESMEQRNRRILLGHVENAWIKGVLDASLHGAALLDLGIKQDPEAVTKYPWAIKKESTDETLPAGTSMLEIFDSIGMGRSLLILGAPGSGKTTMLLELARQLIAHAREDITYPIPMVFNLASWTEKLTLADWLVQELNNLYSVPRKTAPDWVKGNKLLLLLDGLDEVRQESRAKCVEAINAFRKEHGLTSLAVCSRSQDYADLNAKLSFEGAIEVQPLTQEQITEFFNRFGDEMAGIKQALEKDSALRDMAETPLFLSIMLMAYRDKRDVEILVSGDEKAQRKHLFDTYIEHMFVHKEFRTMYSQLKTKFWLSWLAYRMKSHSHSVFSVEDLQWSWLPSKTQWRWRVKLVENFFQALYLLTFGFIYPWRKLIEPKEPVKLRWSLHNIRDGLLGGLALGLVIGFFSTFDGRPSWGDGIMMGLILGFLGGLLDKNTKIQIRPGQVIDQSKQSFAFSFTGGTILFAFLTYVLSGSILEAVYIGISWGLILGMAYGGQFIISHYTLRFLLYFSGFTPWNYIKFLNYACETLFLHRIGGGYIFVHNMLLEHFAEMYVESPTSKGNQK